MESFAVDLKPLLDIGLQLLAAVLLALGTWAVTWVVRKLKLSADSEVRAYLDAALRRGIDFAIEKAQRNGEDIARVSVRSRMAADALNYAVAHVPGALRHFQLTPEKVRDLIVARLPEAAGPSESAPP